MGRLTRIVDATKKNGCLYNDLERGYTANPRVTIGVRGESEG
jgi:hypothetical protein